MTPTIEQYKALVTQAWYIRKVFELINSKVYLRTKSSRWGSAIDNNYFAESIMYEVSNRHFHIYSDSDYMISVIIGGKPSKDTVTLEKFMQDLFPDPDNRYFELIGELRKCPEAIQFAQVKLKKVVRWYADIGQKPCTYKELDSIWLCGGNNSYVNRETLDGKGYRTLIAFDKVFGKNPMYYAFGSQKDKEAYWNGLKGV